MSFDFNKLKSVEPIPQMIIGVMSVQDLCDTLNESVKSIGLEFEENSFTVLVPSGDVQAYNLKLATSHILCAARPGNNEGYYVYVYVSTPTSMTPILSAKGWTWQNMVAIQAVVTALIRDH